MRRGLGLIAAALLITHVLVAPVHADNQPVKNKGLYVTPLRQYITSDTGKTQRGSFTVGNYTEAALTISLFAEQFSVADYTYDFKFESPPKEDWVKFATTQVTLQPYKSETINYTADVPRDAAPGGHYFTLFARTTVKNGSVTSDLQAATVLYVTVNGKLDYSSSIQKSSAPWIVFGGAIPYNLDVKSTGNTHFFIYVSGQLQGFSAQPREPVIAHILLPNTVRAVGGTMNAPVLPGIYKMTYGYKTDSGQATERSSYVLYVPPWSVLIPLGLFVVCWPILKRKKKKPTDS
jgi:hypothetical protein